MCTYTVKKNKQTKKKVPQFTERPKIRRLQRKGYSKN